MRKRCQIAIMVMVLIFPVVYTAYAIPPTWDGGLIAHSTTILAD